MSGDASELLDVIDAVAAELEERLPGYLDRQPLRCVATGPRAELCARISRVWGVPLVAVSDDTALNAVDRYLRARLPALAGADRSHTDDRTDDHTDDRSLAAFRANRIEARAATKARRTALPQLVERRAVASVPGLGYAAIGDGGPPLVAVNAIGQSLAAWWPLIERLSRRRRVLVWEMREADAAGRPVTFAEHTGDLHAILDEERARTCHLIGWCTGAKLAVRYARLHPGAVASLVLVSGSFKHPGRAPELDTAYERNLEAMLRAVAKQPALADRLRSLLARAAAGDLDLDQLSGDALAERALTGVPSGLEREIRRPFRDAPALITYAHQHLELWQHDETATAPEVRTPVLGVAGEHDRIVSPAGFRAAVARFPRSRFELLAGATHHCFHERFDVVGARIEEWIARNSAQTANDSRAGIGT